MCLADLGPVVALETGGGFATVDLAGRLRRVCLAPLVLEDRQPRVGDWLLVHTGMAVEVLDEASALEVVAAREEMR
jgi:hydrogenase assembly chaperone HypC/HupF